MSALSNLHTTLLTERAAYAKMPGATDKLLEYFYRLMENPTAIDPHVTDATANALRRCLMEDVAWNWVNAEIIRVLDTPVDVKTAMVELE